MEISDIESQLAHENQELSGLGFFSIGLKKELKARITNLQENLECKKFELSELNQRLSSCQKEFDNTMSEFDIEQELLSFEKDSEESVLSLESALTRLVPLSILLFY